VRGAVEDGAARRNPERAARGRAAANSGGHDAAAGGDAATGHDSTAARRGLDAARGCHTAERSVTRGSGRSHECASRRTGHAAAATTTGTSRHASAGRADRVGDRTVS